LVNRLTRCSTRCGARADENQGGFNQGYAGRDHFFEERGYAIGEAGVCGCADPRAAATAAPAAIYTDTTGENFDGNAHMDISSVQVTTDGTNITFKINVSARASRLPRTGQVRDCHRHLERDWRLRQSSRKPMGPQHQHGRRHGCFGSAAGWTAAAGSSHGPIPEQLDAERSGAVSISATPRPSRRPLASLGLTNGQTIEFDVYTTGGGGGDSANDSAANASQTTTGWGGPYTTPVNGGLVFAIPEPGTLSVLGGLAGLARCCVVDAKTEAHTRARKAPPRAGLFAEHRVKRLNKLSSVHGVRSKY
jgi:hypothetical protein